MASRSLIALALIAAWAQAGASADGPRCSWDFDGSLADKAAAGQSQDGLTARDAAGRPAAPRFVTAAELPGTSGKALALGVQATDAAYLAAPASADTRLGPSYTIEAWIHPTQFGEWGRLVLCWGPAPQYAYHLAVHRGLLSLYHRQKDGKFGICEGGPVEVGRWHHVAAVARRNDADPAKSTLKVFLNGRPAAAAAFDGTVFASESEGLGIGDSAGAPAAACRFRGYVDDLAIWGRALDDAEVAAHAAQRADLLRQLDATRQQRELAARAKAFARLRGLGVEEVVFACRHPGRDPSGHYYANFGYACHDPSLWLHGRDGGKLAKLNARTAELTTLLEDAQGAIRDPAIHHDGKRILFSYRKGGSHHYNLYEVRTDGAGVRQITDGPWDDVEPAWLPDGDIVFCSTRARRYIGCWFAPTATLHRCGPDGKGIRLLSSGTFSENTPAVLPDGRILYTRWEYVNRDAVSFHHLWTMHADGTGQMAFFGNMQPGGVFIDARPVPGTHQVVLIHSPGHGINEHAGHVALINGRLGPNAPMRQVPDPADFRDPYPIAEDTFLVARGNQVVLLNASGEAEVLHQATEMVHEPRPVLTRPREVAAPPRSEAGGPAATLFLADAYAGRNMEGVMRGAIKKLLVLEDLPKPANYHGGGSQPIGHGVTSTLKRILGTVPVETDGSAFFEAPAGRSLYFAALDASGLSVKQMRSFVTLQPGEALGCVGCHEPRTQAPAVAGRPTAQALARPPSPIQPVEGVPSVLDFPRDVQPVLDRHCVRCHNPEKRDGGCVLASDRGPVYSLSYYDLFLHWQVKDTAGDPRHGSGRQNGNDRPYTTYSSASPLMRKIDGSHYDVRLAPREHATLRLWIDTGAQYAGTYAALGTGQVGGCWGNNEPRRVMDDEWPSTPPARDALGRRCAGCHGTAMPRSVTHRTPIDPWGDMLSWERPLSRFSRHRIYDLSRPEKSLVLLTPLTRKAGGYAEGEPLPPQPVREDRSRPPRPVAHRVIFADAADPDYQAVLAHIQAAKAKLEEIRRFDMPGFRPNEHYTREMQRYGILPAGLRPTDPVDPYATDRAYWDSFRPAVRPTPR